MSTQTATQQQSLTFPPHFTRDHSPYDTVGRWEERTAKVGTFEQDKVMFPECWSQRATNITASKYFRMIHKTRENDLRQMISRVVGSITVWGVTGGYFDEHNAHIFENELTAILVQQRASFNSPVWFNIGVPGVPQQSSACFILDVEDNMPSILNWYTEEGMIFKSGSGSGVNVSKIRGQHKPLSNGGAASGPLSFMRVADKSAGAIKSGGGTRRAAKMVVMDVDHPDIEEFIWCKVLEERKADALKAGGYTWNAIEEAAVDFQNANHSVRVTDRFMMYEDNDCLHQIAKAAWTCGDPGLHFENTINGWHTVPFHSDIVSSNPCSEFFFLNNSACNLASINLLKFLNDDNTFDIVSFQQTISVLITAMDILVGRSDYPTEAITENSVRFRPLGLGYTNLGAALMAQGLPYDSDEGRVWAGSITALMTGTAYHQSSKLAEVLGAFEGFEENKEPMKKVVRRHFNALGDLERDCVNTPPILEAAIEAWSHCLDADGFRNAQATLLAPTGTISFMMDCETTGIEPLLGLTQTKKLVGGGEMVMMSDVAQRGIAALGIDAHTAEHVKVFQTALGNNALPWQAHVQMVAAVQPFLSGGVSKTINMPEDCTVEDVEEAYRLAWKLGLKSIAIYRDGSKSTQPVCVAQSVQTSVPETTQTTQTSSSVSLRRRLPDTRPAITHKFSVDGHEGYLTPGMFENGTLGEIFIRMSKEGSTLGGLMDAFATAVSLGLQYGVPLQALVDKFTMTRFEPAGFTQNSDIPTAQSIVDYVFRWLDREFLTGGKKPLEFPPSFPQDMKQIVESVGPKLNGHVSSHSPICPECGSLMIQTGVCFCCKDCGTSGGCA